MRATFYWLVFNVVNYSLLTETTCLVFAFFAAKIWLMLYKQRKWMAERNSTKSICKQSNGLESAENGTDRKSCAYEKMVRRRFLTVVHTLNERALHRTLNFIWKCFFAFLAFWHSRLLDADRSSWYHLVISSKGYVQNYMRYAIIISSMSSFFLAFGHVGFVRYV